MSVCRFTATWKAHTHAHTHTHWQTRPSNDNRAHTDIKEDILMLWSQTQILFIHSGVCQDAKSSDKANIGKNNMSRSKGSCSSHTHPRAWANTGLARWFTPVWKDKHQPINKSIPLKTCWPPSLCVCHTHNRRGQGQKGMRSQGGESVWCVCVCGHSGW